MPYSKEPTRTLTSIFASAFIVTAVFAVRQFGPPGPPPPFDYHAEMMKQLGLKSIRPGPNPNNQSTFD